MSKTSQTDGFERITIEEGDTGEPIDGVRLTLLAGGEQMNAQRFEIMPGVEVPLHSHPAEQVGQLFEGTLTFLTDDEEVVCEAGDSYSIPAGENHGARNDGDEPAIGVEMFSPPRGNPDWEE